MIGILVICGIVLYLLIAYKIIFYIINKTKKKRYWIGSILFFILLPTWDVIIGKIYFNHLCETEAGLKVYKSVEADGYLSNGHITMGDIELHQKQGFSFIEGVKRKILTKDKIMIEHLSLIDSNQTIQLLDEPKSEYEFIYNEKSRTIKWLAIEKNKSIVKNIKTEDILGESIGFKYYGSWLGIILNSMVSGINNPKEKCLNRPYELLEQTLRKK